MDISELLTKVATYILNPIIFFGFVVAMAVFFYGIIQMITKADSSDDKYKKNVLYGVIGLFVMFSVYGILNLVLDTFDISTPEKGAEFK